MDFETQLRALPADPAAALAVLDGLQPPPASLPAFHLRRGELLELLGRVPEAAAAFGRCLGLTADAGTVRPLLGLARLAIGTGDVTAALGHVDEALTHAPRDGEALVSALALHRIRGGQDAVAAFATSHEDTHGASAELTEALGEEALLSGDTATAVRHLRQAAGDPPTGRAALRLAQAVLAAGDVDAAAELATALLPTQPTAGLGILVCDLVRSRDTALELDLAPAQATTALRPWVDALLQSRRPELLTPFCDNVPAIEPLFPWLPAYVVYSLRRRPG